MKLKLNQDNHTDKPEGFDNIMFGYLGNGITVWDKDKLDTNNFDYTIIAHINTNRVVSYRSDNVSNDVKSYIEDYARTANPTISSTQAELVFTEKAELKPYYFTFGIGQKYENMYVKIEGYTSGDARRIMCEKHGAKWAFQYTEDKWNQFDGTTLADKWGWTELIE